MSPRLAWGCPAFTRMQPGWASSQRPGEGTSSQGLWLFWLLLKSLQTAVQLKSLSNIRVFIPSAVKTQWLWQTVLSADQEKRNLPSSFFGSDCCAHLCCRCCWNEQVSCLWRLLDSPAGCPLEQISQWFCLIIQDIYIFFLMSMYFYARFAMIKSKNTVKPYHVYTLASLPCVTHMLRKLTVKKTVNSQTHPEFELSFK